MKHVIRTQVFEVAMNTKYDVFDLHQKMSEIFYSVILPAIEKTFDETAPGEQYIYLEKLEINLGVLRIEDLTSASWAAGFRELFKRQFLVQVNNCREKKTGITISYSIAQQWIYYMKKGYLPWNTTSTGKEWHLKVLEGLAQDYKTIEELRVLIRDDRRALKRIVFLHDVIFLTHLVEVLTAIKQEYLDQMVSGIVEVISKQDSTDKTPESRVVLERSFWECIFTIISIRREVIEPVQILSETIVKLFSVPRIKLIYNKIAFEKSFSPKHVFKEELPALLPVLKKIVEGKFIVNEVVEKESKTIEEVPKKKQAKAPVEGLFVTNAGLVLLHPFLSRFFGFLDLVKDGYFNNEMKRHQAMILLHFLATGRSEFEEHELVIPKCLCNYDLEETVDPLYRPTREMTDECDELLKDVIGQWPVLKNTSPEGLQVNFLQRPGKLYTKNDETHLLVESKVFDVLLDRLPWGIGMIRLPWMEKALKVEWR